MKSPTPDRLSVQTTVKRRLKHDPLVLAIIGTAIGLAILVVGIAVYWGSGPVIAEIPWIIPMVATFNSLTTLCVAFLAIGRYQVLRDPLSFWVGAGFSSLGIGQVFYILAWPGLLPGDRAIIAQLTNTPAFITNLNLTLLDIFLLAAVLMRWPGKKGLVKEHWLGLVAAWLFFVTFIYILLAMFEPFLPLLVRADETFTPLVRSWAAVLLLLFAVGTIFSTRYYWNSRDALAGYIAFAQMALVFIILMTIIGGRRYDLWWYIQRFVLVAAYLIVLFGLLSEYIRLLRRERESEMRFRQLADAMPQLVWTALLDGTVEYYNRRSREFYGLTQVDNGNWEWSPMLHADDAQATVDAWQRSVETEERYQIEHRARMADGSYRWHLSRAVLARDEYGQATKWFGTATDIQDLKQAESALQKYATELERANRDLQNFTIVASHDLQEPLRKIEAFGDAVLQDSSNLNERQYDRIARMRKSAQQMRNMMNGLLQLSLLSTDSQPFQMVDLRQVALQVLSDLDKQIQQSRGIVEVGELPVIEADPLHMRRLLQHLIENALKFQPPGGEPRVKVYSTRPTPASVQILVEDNGIGFDETNADHIFEPFERLMARNQSQSDGTGIGLAICRWIVERHGGEITAHSKPGQGTTFIVTLPIQQAGISMSKTGQA